MSAVYPAKNGRKSATSRGVRRRPFLLIPAIRPAFRNDFVCLPKMASTVRAPLNSLED